jgi:hypothetical protein
MQRAYSFDRSWKGKSMERRGSEVLREKYKSGGFTLDAAMINELADVLDEFDLRDVFIKGTPRPDFLRMTIDADDSERCGTVVKGLADLLGRRGTTGIPAVLKVFPKGIPWPDAFSVQMDIGTP